MERDSVATPGRMGSHSVPKGSAALSPPDRNPPLWTARRLPELPQVRIARSPALGEAEATDSTRSADISDHCGVNWGEPALLSDVSVGGIYRGHQSNVSRRARRRESSIVQRRHSSDGPPRWRRDPSESDALSSGALTSLASSQGDSRWIRQRPLEPDLLSDVSAGGIYRRHQSNVSQRARRRGSSIVQRRYSSDGPPRWRRDPSESDALSSGALTSLASSQGDSHWIRQRPLSSLKSGKSTGAVKGVSIGSTSVLSLASSNKLRPGKMSDLHRPSNREAFPAINNIPTTKMDGPKSSRLHPSILEVGDSSASGQFHKNNISDGNHRESIDQGIDMLEDDLSMMRGSFGNGYSKSESGRVQPRRHKSSDSFKRKRRRERLLDALTVLSFHVPRCVLGDMTVFEAEPRLSEGFGQDETVEDNNSTAKSCGSQSSGEPSRCRPCVLLGKVVLPMNLLAASSLPTPLEDAIKSPVGGIGEGQKNCYSSLHIDDIQIVESKLSTDADRVAPLQLSRDILSVSSYGSATESGRVSNVSSHWQRSLGSVSKVKSVLVTAVGTRDHKHLRIAEERLLPVPQFDRRESALLFVDIKGFTRLSTLLEVEALSKAINSYFEMMVEEVIRWGGDILKFAGDAFFAEWQALPPQKSGASKSLLEMEMSGGRTLAECALAAAACGAAIVEECSDYAVGLEPGSALTEDGLAVLNVHCGLGVGHLVGLHVGEVGDEDDAVNADGGGRDNNSFKGHRREYLFLGDPIDQAAEAEGMASDGQLIASPQTIKLLSTLLSTSHQMPEKIRCATVPLVIANREEFLLNPGFVHLPSQRMSSGMSLVTMSTAASKISVFDNLSGQCDSMDDKALLRLCKQLSLYVHPVVRGDEAGWNGSDPNNGLGSHRHVVKSRTRRGYQMRHRAEAELRSVFVMFVAALIPTKITGDDNIDGQLFQTLQKTMIVASREIRHFNGHIRQFIVDDKGVVLIATFGLRGTSIPNMVPNNALPATVALHSALKEEVGVDNRVGATYGKVYCGVVGGIRRHEFAVMGAPVNLAARLMCSPQNKGILVDEAVQLQAYGQYLFQNLPSIKAKGYSDLVPTFRPIQRITNNRRDQSNSFIKRKEHCRRFIKVAENIMDEMMPSQTQTIFLYGEQGTGKSSLLQNFSEDLKECCSQRNKNLILEKFAIIEKEKMAPFSGFLDIFLRVIEHYYYHISKPLSGKCTQRNLRVNRRLSTRGSGSSTGSGGHDTPHFQIFRQICQVLCFEQEYAYIVGSRLLGLVETNREKCAVRGKVPTLDDMAEILIQSFSKFIEHADLTVIFLDNAHWIDSLSWRVLCGLVETGRNLLLVCSVQYRKAMRCMPCALRQWGNGHTKENYTDIYLGPFSITEVRELISQTLGYEEEILDDGVIIDVHEHTNGLPVFVAEFLENIKRKNMLEIRGGRLCWRQNDAVQQFLLKKNSSAVFEELFLQRFDSLDNTVRNVLQTCALLGSEFTINDIVRVHPELDFSGAVAAIDAAVKQSILLEEIVVYEEPEMLGNTATSNEQHAGEDSSSERSPGPIWQPFEEKSYRFRHHIWQNCIPKTMLKERRLELHRMMAKSIEEDHMFDVLQSDISTLLQLLEHWKSCGEFSRVAPLALVLGNRMEELGSMQQSLDVCHGALHMLKRETGVTNLDLQADLDEITSESALKIIPQLYLKIARCSFYFGDQEQFIFAHEEAYKIVSKFSISGLLNRSITLSVISGLCLALSWKQVSCAKQLSFENELVKRCGEESRLDGNPVHICRALALEASYFSRNMDFKKALNTQQQLEGIYSFDLHSYEICTEYEYDFAAQSYSESALWLCIVGNKGKAEDQINYVIQHHLPKIDPKDVDTMMSLVFPLLIALKELHMAEHAMDVLQKFVASRCHEFGCSLNRWLSLYKPTLYLLQIARMDETHKSSNGGFKNIELWILNEGISSLSPAMQADGFIILGEICWRLLKRKYADNETAAKLAVMGAELLDSALQEKRANPSMIKLGGVIQKSLKNIEEKSQGRSGILNSEKMAQDRQGPLKKDRRVSLKNGFSKVCRRLFKRKYADNETAAEF